MNAKESKNRLLREFRDRYPLSALNKNSSIVNRQLWPDAFICQLILNEYSDVDVTDDGSENEN